MVKRPRVWVPLDVSFWDDPKILRAVELEGYEAAVLYQRMCCWVKRSEYDGHLPKRLPHGWFDNAKPLLDALVTADLIRIGDKFISITSWHRWNEELATVKAKRKADADRKAADRAAEREAAKNARGSALSTEEQDQEQEQVLERGTTAGRPSGRPSGRPDGQQVNGHHPSASSIDTPFGRWAGDLT